MLTLAEAKVGMADKVDQTVVDEFGRSSELLEMLPFDNTISPGTGGTTFVYGYQQLQTPSTASVRKINEEYTPGEAKRTESTAKAVIMGGSFKLDRQIIKTAGAIDELALQTNQKIIATKNEFHNLVINGNGATEGTGVVDTFDGLDKILTGSQTELTSAVDVSTSALADQNNNALLDEIEAFKSNLEGEPSAYLMNTDLLNKLKGAARRAGYLESSLNGFGKQVDKYNGVPMIDLGKYYDGSKTQNVIPTTEGKTDLYAVIIGQDAFHGISPQGDKLIEAHLPDLNAPGVIKEGDVEFVAGVVLKNSNKAGVLRGIKVR